MDGMNMMLAVDMREGTQDEQVTGLDRAIFPGGRSTVKEFAEWCLRQKWGREFGASPYRRREFCANGVLSIEYVST